MGGAPNHNCSPLWLAFALIQQCGKRVMNATPKTVMSLASKINVLGAPLNKSSKQCTYKKAIINRTESYIHTLRGWVGG